MDITFDPGFAKNGRFYVYYCAPGRQERIDAVLSRFRISTTDPNRADPASAEVLLRIPQPVMDHKAGCIKFGPDGFLWFASGEGRRRAPGGGFGARPHSKSRAPG
jgi:glucose/arabinose dehydrogenase